MTSEQIKSAMAEMERRQEVLDITNAEHIVLWLEANIKDSPIAWLACRIIEAHEAIVTAREASARAEGRREGIEAAAKIIDRVRLWLPNVGQLLDSIKREWAPENCWSAWDQEQRDELTKIAHDIESIRALAEKQP